MQRVIELPLTEEIAKSLRAGDEILLNGEILSARDAAHERIEQQRKKGISLPFDLKDTVIYYMGPSPAAPGQVIGSAGPTTAGRMDRWAPEMIRLGARGMIGKGRRSDEVKKAICACHGVYFGAVGGAGALLSQHILSSEVIAYEDLGPEAVRRLQVKDFPVTVLIDCEGHDLYERGEAGLSGQDGNTGKRNDGTGFAEDYSLLTLKEFSERLASKDPTPGGGGTSALVGSLGCALANMVAHLTIGRKKYLCVQDEMEELIQKTKELQDELLALITEDARMFEPLSRTYSMPRGTEEEMTRRDEAMKTALKDACQVPLAIMECMCRALDLVRTAASKGSALAVSDAGDAAAFCRAALQGAALNVFVNTKLMKDRDLAQEYNRRVNHMLDRYVSAADEIYQEVLNRLRS